MGIKSFFEVCSTEPNFYIYKTEIVAERTDNVAWAKENCFIREEAANLLKDVLPGISCLFLNLFRGQLKDSEFYFNNNYQCNYLEGP